MASSKTVNVRDEYLAEIKAACDHAARMSDQYQSCKESDEADIWDARAKCFEAATEAVGAYYVEIGLCIQELIERPADEKSGEHQYHWVPSSTLGQDTCTVCSRYQPSPSLGFTPPTAIGALRTAMTAIAEATDLLECSHPAANLESATPEEWYEQREAWFGRNRLSEETNCAHPLARENRNGDPICSDCGESL